MDLVGRKAGEMHHFSREGLGFALPSEACLDHRGMLFQAPDLDHVVHATRQETVGMPRVACQCQNFIAVPAFTRDDEHTAPRLQIPQPDGLILGCRQEQRWLSRQQRDVVDAVTVASKGMDQGEGNAVYHPHNPLQPRQQQERVAGAHMEGPLAYKEALLLISINVDLQLLKLVVREASIHCGPVMAHGGKHILVAWMLIEADAVDWGAVVLFDQACKLVLWAPILHAPSSRWMGG
mmetsp:Transcript_18031/g.47148  ORF Transcript_18031/g.47148 Transcript_18031/m.47148 type:complete len:236 (-) Transcript_18031:1592-2299(-)